MLWEILAKRNCHYNKFRYLSIIKKEERMKYFKVIVGILIFFSISFIVLINCLFYSQGTDVAYISSDGKWADHEMLFKGRDFNQIVYFFEEYKIKCNAPDVRLERLRSKSEWYSFSSLFDKETDKKWQVPLSSHFLFVSSGFSLPPIEPSACDKYDLTDEQKSQLKLAAEKYFSTAFPSN